jgi:tetratricopeptide (TPR) repeat protein
MTTTLIVRDAIFAINGAPEQRGEAREHLRTRIREVARMERRTAEECIEVLTSVARGDGADPEALEALVVVALAVPELATRFNLAPVQTGRKLAARLERSGDIDRTVAVLEVLREAFPGQEGLERDLAQLMRRQGTVQDLVARYFERAHKLVREGRNEEAAGWLREVLQLDPTRKDAARLMRNLRFKRTSRPGRSRGSFGRLLLVLALALGLGWTGLREVRLSAEFRALPPAAGAGLGQLKRRLSDLDAFIQRNPVWLGALRAVAERTDLRVQVGLLEEKARAEREAAEQAQRERFESAELCRDRGLMAVQAGDVPGALAAFREALAYGGPDWPQFARVSKDVSDLEAHGAEVR